jgi:hypothetical protein
LHDTTLLEAETRKETDERHVAAGWAIQDKAQINLYESIGVAIREMDTDTGFDRNSAISLNALNFNYPVGSNVSI